MKRLHFTVIISFMLASIGSIYAQWTETLIQNADETMSGYCKVSNPVFSPDGNTIYLPTSSPNGHLFAFDRETGTVKWVFAISAITYGGGAVVDDAGIIYQCGTDNRVYAINPTDGSQRWACDVDAAIGAFPALSKAGILYCLTNKGTLYAIKTSTGVADWSISLLSEGTTTGSAVAVDSDNNVYVGTNKEISKYSSSGTKIWTVPEELNVSERGAFALTSTTLYAALKASEGIVAIDMETGTKEWAYANTGGGDAYFPIVGPDGAIYFNEKGGDKKVYAVNADGTSKWSTTIGAAMPYCGLALSNAGKLYGGTQAKIDGFYQIFEIDVATGTKNPSVLTTDQQIMSSAIIGPDDKLYIGSVRALSTDNFGKLFVVDINAGAETGSWSMRGGNLQGTNSLAAQLPTSINDAEEITDNIQMFNGYLHINVSSAYSCSVYDISGRLQLAVNRAADDNIIDLSYLPKGIYIVKVDSQKEKGIKKIIF